MQRNMKKKSIFFQSNKIVITPNLNISHRYWVRSVRDLLFYPQLIHAYNLCDLRNLISAKDEVSTTIAKGIYTLIKNK